MTIWFKDHTDLHELNNRTDIGFSKLLKIRLIGISSNSLTASLTLDQEKLQPIGIMHGGVTATLAESVASTAANLCVDYPNTYCVGVELNINHLKSITAGTLQATATPYHLGRSTQVWEVRIQDEKERLISISRLTVAVLKRES